MSVEKCNCRDCKKAEKKGKFLGAFLNRYSNKESMWISSYVKEKDSRLRRHERFLAKEQL